MADAVTKVEDVQLLKDEEVFRAVNPHVLGMYQLYVIWFYFVAVAVVFMAKRTAIIERLAGSWPSVTHNALYLTVWVLALLLPAIAIAVARISLRWVLWIGLAAGLGIYLKEFTALGDRTSPSFVNNVENLTVLALGTLGIMFTEWYRRCHDYLVTNRRIVISSQGLWHSERSLPYGKIQDLVLQQTFVGRIFGFGTIIPLTGSGLGAGSEMAGGGVSVGRSLFGANMGVGVFGAHSQNIPKESLEYTIFNVPRPEEIHAFILEKIAR